MKRVGCLLLLLACACAPREAGPPDRPRRLSKTTGQAGAPVADALSSVRLANVPGGTFGPYLGVSSTGAVAVWIGVDANGKRSFYSIAIGDGPKALGAPLRVAEAPGDIGLVAVRPGGGRGARELDASGFVVLSTHRAGGVDSIEALALGPRGELRGGPAALAQPQGEVVWIEAVPFQQRTLALWAIKKDDRADIYAAALGPRGEKIAAPEQIVRGARAWQTAALSDRVALGVVRAGEARGAPGPVEVAFVSKEARLQGSPVLVSAEPTAELDLDVTAIGDRLILAWSDHRRWESQLYVAAVDARGAVVTAPTPATPPFGEQALVRLVPPSTPQGNAYIAWESLMQRPRTGRLIDVAPLLADGKLGDKRARLQFASEDGSVPELVASARGLAALTLAADCEQGKPCADGAIVPTFVELSSELDVVASEPMRLAAIGGETAPLAWALGCRAQGCLSLAALSQTPAPVFAVRLEARSKRWQPAAERVQPKPPPRAVSIEAIAAPDPLSEVAAAHVGASTLAAYVTYFDPTTPYARLKKPAPDGRYEPLRALLEVRSLPDTGEPRPANAISLRARSIAGVALAPGAPEQREALLVWGALDNARPQAFVTLLGEDGKKLRQRMLTRTGAEVSEVAAAYVGDGYLVGWVDERHDNPEIYVTKVDRALRQIAQERRVTHAPGAATGLTLLSRGKEVLAAWADAREGEQPGWADIWTLRLRAADGAPLGEEQRLARTRPHSHSPALATLGNNAVVAWIEEQPESALAADGAGFRIGRLDQDGRALDTPDTVQGAGGAPTSLALDCVQSECHVVMSVDVGGRSELQAVRWAPGRPPRAVPLVTLTGPHAQAVSPVLLGRQIFYADQVAGDRGRVRKLVMDWE